MRNETDIGTIREITKGMWDMVPVRFECHGFACRHPFVDSDTAAVPECRWLDLNDPAQLYEYRGLCLETIDALNLLQCLFFVRKPYRLLWFKLCNRFLSEVDYAECLRYAWTCGASTSKDPNVADSEIMEWFSIADGKVLMGEGYETFKGLPETVTIYRGYNEKGRRNGLSWTLDRAVAENFARAYWAKHPVLLTARIPRDNVLAYFGDLDEQEIIADAAGVAEEEELSPSGS